MIAPAAHSAPSARSRRGLDLSCLFLADVRDGIGPYLAIYLLTVHSWDLATIGMAMAAVRLATVFSQVPAGLLIDHVPARRAVLAAAIGCVALGTLAMVVAPQFGPVLAGQILTGIGVALIPPAIAGISLGLVGHAAMPARIGRNQALTSAGTFLTALLAGGIGHYLGIQWTFYVLIAMCVVSVGALGQIRGGEIDHRLARSAPEASTAPLPGLGRFLLHSQLAIFLGTIFLFHVANAAMLPLAGKLIAEQTGSSSPIYLTACILVAQAVMIGVALLAPRWVARFGAKRILLLGILSIPLRGVLFFFAGEPWQVMAAQILDGVGAGIYGVVAILIAAELSRGSGHFNFTVGAVGLAHALGGAVSHLLNGFVTEAAGYGVGFLVLSGVAVVTAGFAGIGLRDPRPLVVDGHATSTAS